MSSTTNTAINTRSINGIITITDGEATLENGNLDCNDIVSDTLTTTNLISTIFTCNGEIRSNLVGPYTIPVSTSALTGSLISYGNTSNSGATDFTNYGSTYNLLKQGFYFNNINSTTTLTNLAIIDNSQTYFKSQLVGCTAETPLNTTSIVNKTYCDSNFLDRTNNLTQSINGLKTFTNNTNITASLLARTNIKLSEYENSPTSNNVILTFPMSETIALRTTPGTSNAMTVTLPTLSNNERGYVFTFNKLFDTTNNLNFNVTFNTSSGQGIYTLLDQSGTPTSNTTLLSIDKIQCKLAVGFFGSLLYWIEQTDFSTFDRFKLREWQNATQTNSLTLSFPLPPTIALRANTATTMTITLPTLTTNERGKIYTFVKVLSTKFDVTFNTSSSQWIFPLNNLTGTPTTNSTIFPSNKVTTRLAVGWSGTSTYWIEVSDYSTLDIDENNLIYPRLAISNQFTNTNTFTQNSIFTGEAFFNTWVNLKFRTRIYDVSFPQTNYAQIYMINGNEFVIGPNSNGDFISFYCKAATLGQIQTFKSSALGNTSLVKLTCSSSLISNNITAPIVLGGTNNIFTNLDTSTGGANINIGARNNNINVKCNFNINESGYGTGQNTLIWMEGNNSRFENQNSTNGSYIFTIVESGSFNPFVINKTSVDIAGDANIEGNLILYDTTPSTLSMSVGVLGNNMTFDPENTLNTTYNFKVNDSSGTSTTTPLIISTASTTVANTLVCNSQAIFNNGATFNSGIPTTPIIASSANELVNYTTLTTQGYTTLSAVQSNGNTFTATNTFTGNLVSTTGLLVQSSLAFESGTKQVQSYLTSPGELTFQPFFASNSYKFMCINSTNTADKSLFITFDKTTVQTQLEVAENATFNSTATFTGDVTLSKTKNNSSYATYNALGSTYIGYMAEVPAGIYVGIGSGTQYQLGAITLDSSNVGFWTCNYEVEINCSTAGSISKIYVFVSNNLVSTTVPIGLPGAKANNFSTQTYAVGDSTYHSGSFSFLQSTSTVIYGVQLIAIVSSGGFQRKGQIRMLRIL